MNLQIQTLNNLKVDQLQKSLIAMSFITYYRMQNNKMM